MSLSAIKAPLISWYREVARDLPWRRSPSPYHVWISEIMLQQTRIEAVIPYYLRFMEAFPTVEDLAAAPDDLLMKHWEGLGYYSRARNLKRAAEAIVSEHGGQLPRNEEALRALPGIGDYTAGAIASLAFGLPCPAVDGNVLRVLARLNADPRNILEPAVKREAQAALRAVYPTDPEDAAAMTAGLMELGEVLCIPNGAPHCEKCPLAPLCRARAEGLTDKIPYRAKKPPRAIERRTVLILEHSGRIGIAKRPDEGLLGGLWEFPSADGHLDKAELNDLLSAFGLSGRIEERLIDAKHVFTHKEWHMIAYRVTLDGAGGGLTFATRDELRGTYALPSAFRAYTRILLEEDR